MGSGELVEHVLTQEEAARLVTQIKGHLHSARFKLYQLWRGQGWLALGYESWEACLQGEFDTHRSYLYRQIAAAKLEDAAGLEIDTLRESWVREVGSVLDDDEQKIEAVLLALSNGASEAADFLLAAKEVYLKSSPMTIAARWAFGEVSTQTAYDIAKLVWAASLDLDSSRIVQQAGDLELAQVLVGLAKSGHPVWEEVLATGAIPTLGSHVAIGDARARDVINYLTIEETEQYASRLEDGARWDNFHEAVRKLEQAAWAVVFRASNERREALRLALIELRQVNDGDSGGAKAN